MQRPVYLGNLIYSYAREYMYDTIIHDSDSIKQMDTDSGFFSYEDYIKFIDRLPHLQVHSDVKKALDKDDYEMIIAKHPQILDHTEK